MAHEEVLEAGPSRRFQVLLDGHNGIRTNMGTAELGIVIVMVVVGAAPNTARAEDEDAKNLHEPFGQPRARQDSLVLLIVVDDEEPKVQQPSEQTAGYPAREVKIPERACECRR